MARFVDLGKGQFVNPEYVTCVQDVAFLGAGEERNVVQVYVRERRHCWARIEGTTAAEVVARLQGTK